MRGRLAVGEQTEFFRRSTHQIETCSQIHPGCTTSKFFAQSASYHDKVTVFSWSLLNIGSKLIFIGSGFLLKCAVSSVVISVVVKKDVRPLRDVRC